MSGEVDGQLSAAETARIGIAPAVSAFARVGGEQVVRWWNILASADDALPIALVAGIAIASILWNARAGLTFVAELPLATLLIVTFTFFVIAAIFSFVWSRRWIVEVAIYFSLWTNILFFGIRLNYLAATLDFPMQDKLFARADLALGFNWVSCLGIALTHQTFFSVLLFAYRSVHPQCLILIFLFALWGPRGRNRELLIASIFALLLTVAISTVLPALGPRSILGLPNSWDFIVKALRTGSHAPLPYDGIVSFPSFHASMAVMYAGVMRGTRYGFAASLILNGLMLLSTVPIGAHYFVDVIGGCAVGLASLRAAQMTASGTQLVRHGLQKFAVSATN